MTTVKQTEANRANAKKSTGPRTIPGQTAVRFNAVKHGLTARLPLLPGEDAEELDELQRSLSEELSPRGVLERELVNRAASALWRLRRLARIESGLLAWEAYSELLERAERDGEAHVTTMMAQLSHNHNLNDPMVKDEEAHAAAKRRSAAAGEVLRSESVLLGCAFSRDAARHGALVHLSRYEASIERSLYRALRELRDIQASRQFARGGAPEPQATLVHMDGSPGLEIGFVS